MHLVERWGHRIADRPTAKAFRASHRAAAHGTLLHDASYTVFVMLEGPFDLLAETLARVSDPAAVSPSSARYRDGSRSCSVDFYRAEAYPHGLIGPVDIVWRPAADDVPRQCLVACHPSIAELVRGQIDATIHLIAADQQPETGFRLRTVQLCAFELTGPTASDALRRVLESSGSVTDAASRPRPPWPAKRASRNQRWRRC